MEYGDRKYICVCVCGVYIPLWREGASYFRFGVGSLPLLFLWRRRARFIGALTVVLRESGKYFSVGKNKRRRSHDRLLKYGYDLSILRNWILVLHFPPRFVQHLPFPLCYPRWSKKWCTSPSCRLVSIVPHTITIIEKGESTSRRINIVTNL